LSTGLWCHITSSGSATSPNIFLLIRFITAPYRPVISALGMRGLLVMSAPRLRGVDVKTPLAPDP